jgi:hypothetical protein
MPATIDVHVPGEGFEADLSSALERRGLHVELVDDGELCALRVSFADEHDHLVTEVMHAIETWLSDRMLPLVVQRANGGCVVRPPAD